EPALGLGRGSIPGEPFLRRQAEIGEHGGRGMDVAAGRAPAHGAMAGDDLPERAFHLIADGAAKAAARRGLIGHISNLPAQTFESGASAFRWAMKAWRASSRPGSIAGASYSSSMRFHSL